MDTKLEKLIISFNFDPFNLPWLWEYVKPKNLVYVVTDLSTISTIQKLKE